MLLTRLKNYQQYTFTFRRDESGNCLISIQDIFGRDLGTTDNIIITNVSEEQLASIKKTSHDLFDKKMTDMVGDLFSSLAMDAAQNSRQLTFNIQFQEKNGIKYVVFSPYGLQGGGSNNFLAGLTGGATAAVGIALIITTGGMAAPIVGAGLFGAGANMTVYAATTDDKKINSREMMTRAATGFVASVATAGTSSFLAPGASVATTFVGNTARTAGANIVGTLAGKGAEATARWDSSVITNTSVSDVLVQSTVSSIGAQTGVALRNNISSTASNLIDKALSSDATKKLVGVMNEDTQTRLSHMAGGGFGGGTSSVIVKGVSNSIRGRNLDEGLDTAFVVGTTAGMFDGYNKGNIAIDKRKQAELREEKIRKETQALKAEAEAKAKSKPISDKNKTPSNPKSKYTPSYEHKREQGRSAQNENPGPIDPTHGMTFNQKISYFVPKIGKLTARIRNFGNIDQLTDEEIEDGLKTIKNFQNAVKNNGIMNTPENLRKMSEELIETSTRLQAVKDIRKLSEIQVPAHDEQPEICDDDTVEAEPDGEKMVANIGKANRHLNSKMGDEAQALAEDLFAKMRAEYFKNQKQRLESWDDAEQKAHDFDQSSRRPQ